jgi:hypothetical protein
MSKETLFIIFGLTLSIAALISVFLIRKSNRQFLHDEAENERKKKLAAH